ncbi:insulinase family protein [Halomonas korlensis]|uniref:Peptidase M16 inactive domain-containing protein n=1 Tax=Halomonas korlensis TaxID=463301 RepID=A0A1I7JDC6_9GAMM|nr:insulinase family protein [Halomonas korlensis]SFU83177.1 Peptidase M16 inactive domain-containing protein [Halomonas korlensis]
MGKAESALASVGLPPDSRVASRRLANGLWIMAAQVPRARQSRLVGAAGVGYLDDPPDCRGLAHLLEHGLFLGSGRWPGRSTLARWVGTLGGRYNAHTGEGVTDVHLHLPVDAAEAGLARLVDLLGYPRLDPDAVVDEVEVLDAEFRARLDDPALHRLAALGRLFDPSHPAAACHAGNRATLGSNPRDLVARLQAFHAHHYRAERMALVMLGPQSTDEQLGLLERHGRQLPATAADTTDTPSPDRWRWASPRGVSWHLPNEPSLHAASTLELLWPLPETLADACAIPLQAIASQLNDGALAATLQQAYAVQALEASTPPEGTGPALCLAIELVEPPADIAPLVATCQQALRKACRGHVIAPAPRAVVDLDAWPREQARQLSLRPDISASSPMDRERRALSAWLAPEQCRLLWRKGAERPTGAWRHTEETATPWRPLDLSCPSPALALPEVPAPHPRRRNQDGRPPGQEADDRPTAGLLYRDARLSLWWDGLDWPTLEGETGWCLGWSAAAAGHDARLRAWQRRTLALRQAADARGQALTLGSDARGDWLMARGSPAGLASLVDQALDDWMASSAVTAPTGPASSSGLLAQQMLGHLETRPPPCPSGAMPALLCWARGEMGTREAQCTAKGFAERLSRAGGASPPPDALQGNDQAMTWLAPQGDDRAVMLEVEGADDGPRMRWLLQLLAHCHDAAFHREMRQRRGLGYVAAVRYRESSGWPRLGYVVQSPKASVETLHQAILAFLDADAVRLAQLEGPQLERLRRGLLARQGPPETQGEAIERAWQALRRSPSDSAPPPDWRLAPWQQERAALDSLTAADLEGLASALARGALAMRWWAHAPASPCFPPQQRCPPAT